MRKKYFSVFPVSGLLFTLLLNGCGFSDLKNAPASSGTSGTVTTTGGTPPSTPTPDPSTGSGGTASFSEVNSQIFQAKCVQCHGSGGTSPDLATYSGFATNTNYIVPGSPSTSLIYELVQSGTMPQGGTPLTSSELSLMSEWITQGALNN